MSELSLLALDTRTHAAEASADGEAPSRGPATLRWSTVRQDDPLETWQPAVDALVDRAGLPELASGAWWSAFWQGFHPGDGRVEVALLHRGAQLVAAVPVRASGRLVRARAGLENEHVPCWAAAVDPAALEDRAVRGALVDRLTDGVDYLELRRLPVDGPLARALKREAADRGWPTCEWRNPVAEVGLPLEGPWPAFEGRLSKNLRRDARLLTKLSGQVAFEVVTGGDRLPRELAACFELEARGWKGQLGTPVLADAGAHLFYRRLAERASRRGRFALYLLKLDGQLVAFEYTVRGGGRIECLKIGYDETLSRYSPGTGLRMLILRRAIERGEAREYRLGRDSEWKRRWITDHTRIGTLRIYAGTRRGRLAFFGGPALRDGVKRVPGAQRLVDGLRRTAEAVRARLRSSPWRR